MDSSDDINPRGHPLPTRRRAVTSSLLSQNMLQAQTALLDNEIVTLRDNVEVYRLIRVLLRRVRGMASAAYRLAYPAWA